MATLSHGWIGELMEQSYMMRRPLPAPSSDQSFWIKHRFPDGVSRTPELREHLSAAVAIIGGGLTGLWTAWRILEMAPGTEIILLEADFCGSGASGRNGGQVHSWFNYLPALCAFLGEKDGMSLAKASRESIDELQQLQDSGRLEMSLRRDGWYWMATSRAQLGAWGEAVQISRRQKGHPYEPVAADELRQKVGSESILGGVVEPGGGTLDPFLLIRSLRRSLIEQGVRIYENTPVTNLTGGVLPTLQTPLGSVRAGKVLLASNAWAGAIPELNRYMFAFDAQVIATEQNEAALDSAGLRPGCAMGDSQTKVNYWMRTEDDRLLMGRGSGIPIYRDRIGKRSNRDRSRVSDVTKELHRLYPELARLKVAHDWIGTVDFTASRIPLVGCLKQEPNIVYCVGWSGTALAQIPLVARILAELMVPRLSGRWAHHPLINSDKHIKVIPEPIRYVGSRLVKRAVDRASDRQSCGQQVDPLTRTLVSLVPKYRKYRA